MHQYVGLLYSTTHEQRRVWSRVGCETRTCVMRAKRVQLPLASIAVHVCYTCTFARGEDSEIQNTRQSFSIFVQQLA